jgi:ComF family protein
MRCMLNMPRTRFEKFENNPVEKMLTGRINFITATAQYYYTKASLMQRLIHQVKYKSNRELGLQLGRLMGEQFKESLRINPHGLIPLPLFFERERKRGYNQSELLCRGISDTTGIPVLKNVISRPELTETQTRKGRIERWKNMDGKFLLQNPEIIEGKHLLLVDDVITTGATLEACGNTLLQAPNCRLSIAALCLAVR